MKHDIESYVITIRRKNAGSVAQAVDIPEQTVLKPAVIAPVAPPVKVSEPVHEPSAGGKTISSPLPGVIVAVKVKVGDTVKIGDVVAVLEAMKMENEIQAECDGTVTAVGVSQGDSILEGAAIVTIN